MSLYFNSLNGGIVGQTGTLNSGWLANLQARQSRDEDNIYGGETASLYDYSVMNGYRTDTLADAIANSAGYQNGSIDFSRSVTNNNNDHNVLFQDKNGNFLDIDFDKGTFAVKSEKNIVEEAGLKMNQYDKLTLDQGGFTFIKFIKSGLGDGIRDYIGFFRQKMDNLVWGATSVIYSEVSDTDDTSQL
ncbi:hypothetical protein IJS77_02835 [bacterium]|nr:hypothetical protein [bacterium]